MDIVCRVSFDFVDAHCRGECEVNDAPYSASAAANIPTAPFTSAIAYVGRGPAGARPVLCAATLDPDVDPDVVGEAGPVVEGVWEADTEGRPDEPPVAVTIVIDVYNPKSSTSLCFQMLVKEVLTKVESGRASTEVQVRSASVTLPCHLQATSAVYTPGTGSVRWYS